MRANFLATDGLFCFITIYKFGSFKKRFPMSTSLSGPYSTFIRFIQLAQTKKVISMNYDSCSSSWKPWRRMRLDLILPMRDIYINSNLKQCTKFTSSSRSTEFKNILPWSISQMLKKTIPISTRIVMSYAMKQDILYRYGITETKTWSEFPNRKKAIVEIPKVFSKHDTAGKTVKI